MTKRTLVIIIALLVIMNIIAALWYVSLRIEKSGDSYDIWQSGDTTVTMADTLSGASVPDSFQVMQYHAFFVSREPVVRDDFNSYYTCVKTIKVRWPISVNGNDSIRGLEDALLTTLFGNDNSNVTSASLRWVKQPRFTVSAPIDYKEIDTKPKLVGHYAYQEQLLTYPILTSLRLLVMQTDHVVRNGENTHKTSKYVHYDRVRQALLSRNDIFESNHESQLLGMINEKIGRLNQTKRLNIAHATRVSSDYYAQRTGIIFEYPAGEIAPLAEGTIQILLEYPNLGPALTRSYKNLLRLNDGYWKYKSLEIE